MKLQPHAAHLQCRDKAATAYSDNTTLCAQSAFF